MAQISSNSAFSQVTALAQQRPVHAAFAWLHGNPKTIMDWQAELAAIPAPPFGEQARAEWLAERFAETGLSRVETDEEGNVYRLADRRPNCRRRAAGRWWCSPRTWTRFSQPRRR